MVIKKIIGTFLFKKKRNLICMKENTEREVQRITNMYVPENPRKWCTGFSYIGPKLYNMIPKDIKEAKTTDDFKTQLKGWIWKNIH